MKAFALAVLLLVPLAACSRDRGLAASENQKPKAVTVETAQVRDVRRQVDVVGTRTG